jgi:hypothetical protein
VDFFVVVYTCDCLFHDLHLTIDIVNEHVS